MEKVYAPSEIRQWVHLHIVAFVLIVLASVGMVIIDGKIGEFVGHAAMAQLRTVLFLSVLLAGIGARALLARNTATIDTQGWVFLVLVGMLFLAVAAYGFADCFYQVWYAHDRALAAAQKSTQE